MLSRKYPVTLLCEIAEVSPTCYYRHLKKPIKRDSVIEEKIRNIYINSGKIFGYRKVTDKLKENEIEINKKKVQRIMSENEYLSIVRKKKYKKPVNDGIVKENLINRDFSTGGPGEKYLTDITYIPTNYSTLYLCVVMDLFGNRPVAWSVDDNQEKTLVTNTLRQLEGKVKLDGSIIHSDRGVQYTSKDCVSLMQELNANQSMSRKGNCWDNAPMESFFSHYKCETVYLLKQKVKNKQQLKEITDKYMDFYINDRPQSKLGGLPPSKYIDNIAQKL